MSKIDLASGEEKLRPCLDASPHLNKFLVYPPVKLTDLRVSEKMLEPGDFQTSLDLENMYFHVYIHPDHQKFLGFQIPHPDSGVSSFTKVQNFNPVALRTSVDE